MAWITLGENNPVHSMVDVFKVTLGKMIKIHLLEYFCYFAIFSPWKLTWPFIVQTYIPFSQGYFILRVIEIGPMVLGEK